MKLRKGQSCHLPQYPTKSSMLGAVDRVLQERPSQHGLQLVHQLASCSTVLAHLNRGCDVRHERVASLSMHIHNSMPGKVWTFTLHPTASKLMYSVSCMRHPGCQISSQRTHSNYTNTGQ